MSNLATLRPQPFSPGNDPRRIIPNNTGKRYEHSAEYILRKLLSNSGGKVDGVDASRFDVALFLLIKDAMDTNLAPIDRHRAVNTILDRIEGKALQRNELSRSIEHNVTGKRLAELSIEELNALVANADRYLEAPDGTIIEVEYEETAGDGATRKSIAQSNPDEKISNDW